MLARALLAQGKLAEAEAEIRAAATPLRKNQDFTARLDLAIASARTQAALGNVVEAKRKLGEVQAAAIRSGWMRYSFRARLALGEIELQSGQTAAGRARLEALEKDATAKGFCLAAKGASTLAFLWRAHGQSGFEEGTQRMPTARHSDKSPDLVSECDFFVQFWRTRQGPDQFAHAVRDVE